MHACNTVTVRDIATEKSIIIILLSCTGQLPIAVDMDALPDNTLSDNETPPPLPPKIAELDICTPDLHEHTKECEQK